MLEERQRIARDVHDLVGHSLSVTMLHLTAARRDLEEAAAGHASMEEAVEALGEAERVGRRAMSDIRRTVDLLGRDEPAATMAARAQQLGARFTAGPQARSWVVHVELLRGDGLVAPGDSSAG